MRVFYALAMLFFLERERIMKKAQSIFEYFILFGVCAVIIVAASKTFKTDVREKLMEYRDHQAETIITANATQEGS